MGNVWAGGKVGVWEEMMMTGEAGGDDCGRRSPEPMVGGARWIYGVDPYPRIGFQRGGIFFPSRPMAEATLRHRLDP